MSDNSGNSYSSLLPYYLFLLGSLVFFASALWRGDAFGMTAASLYVLGSVVAIAKGKGVVE